MNGDLESFKATLRNGLTLPPYEGQQDREPPPAPPKPTGRGRFQTLNAFVDYSARLVDTTAQAVWLVLFRETKPNGLASISQGQIGELIGTSKRTARRAIDSLVKVGLVEVVKRAKCGGDYSVYRVHGTPNK